MKWAEWQSMIIIDELMRKNPEPLIKYMREGGDMKQFNSEQLDVIATVLRGEKLKGKGRPENERIRNRNVELMFHVAWFIEEGFSPDKPTRSKKVSTAFDKAVEAVGDGVAARTAYNLWWEKCTEADRDYYRKQARD